MPKTLLAALCLLFIFPCLCFSQCLIPLPEPACNGTEPLASDGNTVSGGTTQWYYGSTATFNSLTLDGGTLVVCGDLTVDKFYMNTGKIFIRQGARFVIGSGIGSGLQFKGDCAIYNYGTCQIQRNLSLENNASAATPNIVMNALSSSIFLMSNQYFVINNAFSLFVNNGRAEFWGIITDQQSVATSVCLGNGSSTKMAILINKIANTYTVPSGIACVNVYQLSEFYGQLTSNPNLFACLGSTHTSSTSCIPFGCHPNYWGAAQVFTNCSGCAAVNMALPVQFISLSAIGNNHGYNKLQWETDVGIHEGVFTILRSPDGKLFTPIDSIPVDSNSIAGFNLIDKHPLNNINYYMIRYTNIQTGVIRNSRIAKVISKIKEGFSFYPVPFHDKFTINYERGVIPQKLLLKDVQGRDLRIRHTIHGDSHSIEVFALDKLPAGLYIIHMKTDKSIVIKPILKN
ncbi:MAG: T9SS type A sorting domain-containing protein [Bacteroidota bacterium]